MCVCLNCRLMSPRVPKLGWCIYSVFREGFAHLSGTLQRGHSAHKGNREMGEQSIDFMLKRLGPCDSVKMPSIFDKRFWYARLMVIMLSVPFMTESKL